MTSIDELEAHLLEIDKDFKHDDTFAKGSQLAGVSFDKTLNALTLTGEPKDFSVFIPWKVWTPGLEFTDDNAPKLGDSALQEAFKHVLERGRFLADNKMCFIDIAHLWDGVSEPFFEEGSSTSTDEKTKSVAKAIADVIDGVEGDSSEITVRFLVGDFTMTKHTLESATNFINNIFWPGKQPLVKNQKNARLYIGQYSPGWDFK